MKRAERTGPTTAPKFRDVTCERAACVLECSLLATLGQPSMSLQYILTLTFYKYNNNYVKQIMKNFLFLFITPNIYAYTVYQHLSSLAPKSATSPFSVVWAWVVCFPAHPSFSPFPTIFFVSLPLPSYINFFQISSFEPMKLCTIHS